MREELIEDWLKYTFRAGSMPQEKLIGRFDSVATPSAQPTPDARSLLDAFDAAQTPSQPSTEKDDAKMEAAIALIELFHDTKVVQTLEDGSLLLSNGIIIHPGGTWSMPTPYDSHA